ncbi:ARID DNA-binding domain-containing protein, partial [Tanacetum coccineum]
HKVPTGSPFTKMAGVILAALHKWKVPVPSDPKLLHELDLSEYAKKGKYYYLGQGDFCESLAMLEVKIKAFTILFMFIMGQTGHISTHRNVTVISVRISYVEKGIKEAKGSKHGFLHKANFSGMQRYVKKGDGRNHRDIYIKDDGHGYLVPGVHYAPEVTLNILSMDLLEKQGMRTLHNQYLENYFGSLDDGIDEGLIIIKGSLYSTKIHLFDLYKLVETLGGYLNVQFCQEFDIIGEMMGLPKGFGDELKRCYNQYLDVFTSYFKTARAPRRECIRDFNQADPNLPSNNLEEGTGAQPNAGLEGKEKVEHFGVKLEGTSSKEDTPGKDPIPHSARNLNLQGMHSRYSIPRMQEEDDSGTDNTSEEFTIIT